VPEEMSTWEYYHVLKEQFPNAAAWGQAPSPAGGTAMTQRAGKSKGQGGS
jgi:hypothetical protein